MLTYILIDASTYANIYIYIRKVRSQFILGGGYTQVTALNKGEMRKNKILFDFYFSECFITKSKNTKIIPR